MQPSLKNILTVLVTSLSLILMDSCIKKEPAKEDDTLVGSPGNPRFNLQFDNHDNVDLDLYVTDPKGNTIYWSNPYSSTGGQLDVDCLCGYCSDGPNENIFWPEDDSAPKGTYKFWVNYFDSCTGAAAASNFTVRVTYNNRIVETYTGRLSSGNSTTWTYVKN